jgi:hypothetical protein
MRSGDEEIAANQWSSPMTTRKTLIGLGIAGALAIAVGAYGFAAFAQGPGPGWGMMGGYGPGYHMGGGGYGPGYHMGGGGGGPGYHMGWGGGRDGGGPGWNCPAFGQDGAAGPNQGYGPGYGMRGWGRGYGPGMMRGYGYNRGGEAQTNLNLTADDVKKRMEHWLEWRDNPRLKLGEVKEKDADTFTVDVVTKDNSLVDRFIVDRHTGFTRRDNG